MGVIFSSAESENLRRELLQAGADTIFLISQPCPESLAALTNKRNQGG